MKFLLATLGLAVLALGAQAKQDRDFSVFQVVRFPNGACESNNKLNGTCFTKQECEDKDGKESGTCADGYGVCCTFEIDECGKTSSQNNTYITKPTKLDAGSCTTKICPAGDDICRLRIDFMTFAIAQPETSAVSSVLVNGAIANTPQGQCHTDSFRVTCPGGPSPNVICGTATGQHMYVDAAKSCNDLTFFIGRATATRMWNIKVSQIDCEDMVNLPPPGCTQWFTEDSGTIQTFNFATNQKHLANQNQNFCFRKNKGMCGVCVFSENEYDFDLSKGADGALVNAANSCCGYGAATPPDGAAGFDCLEVPGAKNDAWADAAGSRFCGNKVLAVAAGDIPAASVCTKTLPLSVRFLSDNGEIAAEATGGKGFKLKYDLKSTCA